MGCHETETHESLLVAMKLEFRGVWEGLLGSFLQIMIQVYVAVGAAR